MNIPNARLANQHINAPQFSEAQQLVAYMGAIQAQDFPMARWAIGLRVHGATDAAIEQALNTGKLVRTHILRPTWHIVAAQHVRWMMALTGKSIKAASASRDRELGIDVALYARTNDLICKALADNNHLTRAEIMQFLEQNGVKTDPSRAVHFMAYAETDALICNGIPRGKEQTYALLDEKVPDKGLILTREESLAELAKRYFTSHGPATLPDFQWWSGLSMTDARAGLASIRSELETVELGGRAYFFHAGTFDRQNLTGKTGIDEEGSSLFLLPAFDEYCVSYKHRTDVFAAEWQGNAITSNGIFKPIIVVNGKIEGLWKRTIQKNKVVIETQFFGPNAVVPVEKLAAAAANFGQFLGLPTELRRLF
ncbi:MAG: winged helix DNA-binding domain-containing protein [Cytophagales bacterium]|nr:MAG: winged helix DNA-binding domain-containing protein [Cytophagales bacterium]